jgi:uncharacterized protein YcnI
MHRITFAAAAAMALAAMPASAHVTLDPGQVSAGTTARIAFRVPHGCDGAATTRLVIRLPEGVTQARPMPKAGWTLRITPRSEAPAGHGAVPDAAEIAWEGGRLEDAHYDEFVMRLRLPDRPGEPLHIAAIQECEGGRVSAWADIPEAGRRVSDYRHPAPAIRLLPRN